MVLLTRWSPQKGNLSTSRVSSIVLRYWSRRIDHSGVLSRNVHSFANISSCVIPSHDSSIYRVYGESALKFMQGMTTNDLLPLHTHEGGPTNVVYTSWLSPKGRFLFDSFVSKDILTPNADGNSFLVQVLASDAEAFEKHVKKYRLRANVQLESLNEQYNIWNVLNNDASELESFCWKNPCSFLDPRLPELGVRLVLPSASTPSLPDKYEVAEPSLLECLRLYYGIPKSGIDMTEDDSFPLECNIDWMNGMDFKKGCYVGQEIQARTHFKGVIRKRLMPVLMFDKEEDCIASDIQMVQSKPSPDSPLLPSHLNLATLRTLPESGSRIHGGKKAAGKLYSSFMNLGIAQIRLSNIGKEPGYFVWTPSMNEAETETEGATESSSPVYIKPLIPYWWPETVVEEVVQNNG